MDTAAVDTKAVDAILERLATAKLSPEMALRELAALAQTSKDLSAAIENLSSIIDRARKRSSSEGDRIAKLVGLYEENKDGCAKYLQVRIFIKDTMSQNAGVSLSIDDTRTLNDKMVEICSDTAAVNSISMGNTEILQRATQEIVDLLDAWTLLRPDSSVLQIACGNGRFEAAIAGKVHSVYGIDISPNMIAAARRNCEGLTNVHLAESSGRDLQFADRAFDLVYSVDAFPIFLSQGIVEEYVKESFRVLKPGGDLVMFKYSFGTDEEKDRREVRALADSHGFSVIRDGVRPVMELWDGLVFQLRKRS